MLLNKVVFRLLALVALGFFASPKAQAQPANDNFANAWALAGSVVTTNGSNGSATKEAGEPSHAGNQGGRSVWFIWTAPTSGQIQVNTVGSLINTLLAVYTGTAVNALTPVASANGGFGSQVQFQATQGTTYRIAVDARRGNFTPGGGNYVLNIRTLATIAISSPTNGTPFTVGAPIPINVTGSVPTPPITRVDFYSNGSFFGTDDTSPYSAVANNVPVGTNQFYVVAVDSGGINWTSGVVNVGVLNLGITIVAPVNGSLYLNNTTPVPVSVATNLLAGAITNVEFFVDGQKFAEDAIAPFAANWNSVSGGTHRLTAVGRDDSGNVYQSNPVNVGVAETLIPFGAVWKYLDNGSDQGTAWRNLAYNDTSWASGPGELGYGDGDEVTVVGFGPDPNNKFITTYFRRQFVLTNASKYFFLLENIKRDDGAIVYLNGVELSRFNMNAGAVDYRTLAPIANDDGATVFSGSALASALVEGTNLLAVEIHQTAVDSSDISFNMELLALPTISFNQSPTVALTSPTNNANMLGPVAVNIDATASDSDGSVTKVEFYVDGQKIGEDASSPFTVTWSNPPIGPHVLQAIAFDDQGASQSSAAVAVNVYDAAGLPFVRVIGPTNGTIVQGPTNLSISAYASAIDGITNVEFQANGLSIGNDTTSPYSVSWSAPFGTNALTAIASDLNGKRSTSAVVNVVITIPPTNIVAPTIAGQVPVGGSATAALTSITVNFSENVINVDASDLLINGVPATKVSGTGSNYIFTFPQPAYGTVNITWASGHGITDIGYPSNLPFNENGPGATWVYFLLDTTAPTVVAKVPAANATLTNLSQISVTFSEAVSGVDATDLLVNGSPAFAVTSADSTSYLFTVSQPPSGLVNVSWASGHGITDLASPPNAFNATGAGATWSYTLDNRTILVQTNALWRFVKGTSEASTPIDAWRQLSFNDSTWSNSLAPFYYGDIGYTNTQNPGTPLPDMANNGYASIFMRKTFVLNNASAATNLFLVDQSDDGYIAWINGFEVERYNMPQGDVPYNGSALGAVNEPNQNGAGWLSRTLPIPTSYLVNGTNILSVHAFNVVSTPASSDFGINLQLYTYLADPSVVAPQVANVSPASGEVFVFTNLTITFTEPVTGVDASDLLINGVAASGVSGGSSNLLYTFNFPQPAYGPVSVTWAGNSGIVDFDATPKAFVPAGASYQFSLINPNAPTVASQVPAAGAALTSFSQVSVTFSKPVTGVNASDLLVNGAPASGVSGSGANWVFSFPQPSYGNVTISWAANHGIEDQSVPPNPFDATRAGAIWTYNLVDQVPPVILAKTPPAGAQVTNLSSITVTFSEPVSGVNASDLLVNGAPASAVSGSGATWTFTFPQPNATVVNISWANNHGIRDLAATPNNFNGSGVGATWSYTTPDTLPPAVLAISPLPSVTLRTLTDIRVSFTEPVTGVSTNSLLLNNQPARFVAGSGAGPYIFTFAAPAPGPVELRWALASGIFDLGTPPNPFGGGEWTYILDPNATFANKVVVNEIMYDPFDGSPTNEWIELKNVSTNLVNLTGWQFTKGVDFTFPNISMAAGGFLVVAADVGAFHLRYPAISNVIGNWTGSLGNNGNTLELSTALGEQVNSLHYATEGDWAVRERGNGPSRVLSITRSGSTATVTVFGHGFSSGDQVVITGADQPEYNGRFSLSGITASTFNITVSGTPASAATGGIAAHQVLDDGASGWSWFSPASGYGYSLELINPALPNSAGENWSASANVSGTPGRTNSNATNNIAPLIEEVTHTPAVPRSTDSVAISARITDELSNGVQSVTLFYRNHSASGAGANPFSSAPMLDDGAHSDGVSGDGLFGAVLPPNANGAVIEFYVQATDTSGHTRAWPAGALDTNGPGGVFGAPGQYANALYQVDNEVITNNMPAIRTILSGTERALFPNNINNTSDASMNCTMVSLDGAGTQVRYLCDVRIRGAGSRSRAVKNNRVGIPNDNPWKRRTAINLNSQFIHAQLLGNIVAARAGLPNEEPYVVQYRMNGVNLAPTAAPSGPGGSSGSGWGVFLLLKPMDGDLGADTFPLDSKGNTYRASTGNHNADLNYLGTDPNLYLNRGVYKTSNKTENDWSDFIRLVTAMSQVTDPVAYAEAIRTNVNVGEWMTYFAVASLSNDGETKLGNGLGDDYALYSGVLDKRFVIFAHDFDTVFGQGDTTGGYYPVNTNSSIFIMLNPPNPNGTPASLSAVLRRFMSAHAPSFYSELKRLCDTVMSPPEFNALVDQYLPVGSWQGGGPDSATVAAIKSYAGNRRSVVLSQIPLNLTVNHSLSLLNGYPSTTTPSVTLFGTAHAIDTRKVLVNGVSATWSALDARWTNTVSLQPGINHILVQSLNSNNVEFASATLDVWYDDATLQPESGTLSGNPVWTAAGGPYNITANLTVPSGVTLTIQPGTTLYLASGVTITVSGTGKILAQGTEAQHIRIGKNPAATGNWGSLDFIGATTESRLSYVDFDSCGGTTIGGHNAQLHVNNSVVFIDHCTWPPTPVIEYISFDASSFIVQNCVFPTYPGPTGPESLHGINGIPLTGYGIFRDNYFGHTWGFNDTIDFTGGQRPGAILQVINNVFDGSGDDNLDLDSTDAWIEGNIFMHVHRDPTRTDDARDTSSAISGGIDFANQFSEWTVINNLFYDVDHAILNKGGTSPGGGRFIFANNTLVHVNKENGGGLLSDIAAFDFTDDGIALPAPAYGAGAYIANNIIWDCPALVANYNPSNLTVIFENNLLPQAWSGPGSNNVVADPMLNLSLITNVATADWKTVKAAFKPRSGSPALGSGIGGFDKGGLNPKGLLVYGEPLGNTPDTSLTLSLFPGGVFIWGSLVPPYTWGYTHYKWKLDEGPWSAEISITNQPQITVSGLSAGPHAVYVAGKNDAGFYQDDPFVYPVTAGVPAHSSSTKTWNVTPGTPGLRLNEVLAANVSAYNHNGTTPDAIELYNSSASVLDLTGIRLTTSPANPDKFIFPQGTTLAGHGYLVVYANNPDGTSGIHLGFNLSQGGESLYLYDSSENGGVLLDSITFGAQLTDFSIGRLGDGSWALNIPTLGAENRPAATGDPSKLRINEWLAISQAPLPQPFLELFNLDSAPVDMGGLYLSDLPIGWPLRDQITSLSFIPGGGYFRFICDGDIGQGADHTSFHLDNDAGFLSLLNRDQSVIDYVSYQPQSLNIAQGRSPNGAATIVFFDQPTPGAPNPVYSVTPNGGALVINEVLANNASFAELSGTNSLTPDWIELYNGSPNPINLSDMSLTDDTLLPRKYVLTNGVALAPGAFFRILCSSSVPPATNNTGFSLKSAGGGVYLFDSTGNGGSLVSSIVYGLQLVDFSIGRIPDGSTNWVLNTPTPAAANVAITSLGNPASLKINEWMADPVVGQADWFEVFNPNNLPVALGGLYLTDDLNNRAKHKIAALSFIGFGTNAWLTFQADNTPLAGPEHVNFSLKGTGEALGISSNDGTLIDGVTFGQQLTGVSEGRFPDGSNNIVSFPGTDSAGESNYRLLTEVAINEVLTHTDPPLEDAIELFNLTAQPIDLSGWWLSDDKGTLQKYQIPSGTVLPANGYKVIYEVHFTNNLEAAIPFALSSAGDEVVLSSANGGTLSGYRTRVKFGAANNGVSFGRYLTSEHQEEFVAMASRSFGVDDPSSVQQFRTGAGAPNSYPRVGPVVISQLMYHPPDLGTNDNLRDEYIQLKNISTVPVPLFDTTYPTNVWHLRNAVDFDFPSGLTLPAGGTLLVVGFDPVNNPSALSAFRTYYGLSQNSVIVGPWIRKLGNDTDVIELRRPDSPNLTEVPYVLLEKVKYSDLAPWDPSADGTGLSLQRVSATGFANDPTNWVAGIPNLEPQGATLDSDLDGIPDAWETAYGLDPFNAADANIDSDGDGMTNLQEYLAGTDPRSALSTLRLLSITIPGSATNAQLSFAAISNHTYSILWKEGPAVGKWTKLVDVSASAQNTTRTIIDPLPLADNRIYRVATPKQLGAANPLPAILTSPRSVFADVGQNPQFTVFAVASGLPAYQWLFNGNSIAWGTGSTLTVTNVQFSDVGLYSVVVSENGTNDSSAEVSLSVRPHISTQPQSQSVSSGNTVVFTVGAEGIGTLSYRWYFKNHLLAGQTASTLTLSNVQAADAGQYSVVVTHNLPWGKAGVLSSNAVLTVTP